MFALLRVLKVGTLLIFALEQKLKVHWNGLQMTFLLSYCTSKSEQAENFLVLPIKSNENMVWACHLPKRWEYPTIFGRKFLEIYVVRR